jgi:NTE family protein
MVGFVLSGGASLGAVEAGMVRALYEHGIGADLIVGTSAGAVNGAYLASRPPTPGTAAELDRLWRDINTLEVFPPNPLTAVLGLIGERDHLVPNTGVKAVLEANEQFTRMQDAPTPFHVVTTDVLSGERRLISTGDALSAVLASAAIPGVFPAIDFEGRKLVDGGVAENTPIADAVALGADPVYVLPTGGPCALAQAPQGAIQMLVHALTLLINQRLVQDIETYSKEVRLVVFPPPCPQPVPAWDFGQAGVLLEQGYRSASAVLSGEGDRSEDEWRTVALERLRPHGHRRSAG